MVEDWISQANARQRRGRAGRVKPGICFCLYTRHRFEKLMRSFQVLCGKIFILEDVFDVVSIIISIVSNVLLIMSRFRRCFELH